MFTFVLFDQSLNFGHRFTITNDIERNFFEWCLPPLLASRFLCSDATVRNRAHSLPTEKFGVMSETSTKL